MKVLVNGGLNMSVLDGWWAEAYAPSVGWAIGDGNEHHDDPAWDRADAEALYATLENQVVPEFYDREESGIPRAWVARVRESMALLTPAFSANRTVRQYTEEQYIPAAAAYAARTADQGHAGAGLLAWQHEIARHWNEVRFGALEIAGQDGQLTFEVEVFLGGLDPNAVRVELYADPLDGGEPFRQQMERREHHSENPASLTYRTNTPASRPAADFTPRIFPYHPMAGPLEINRIIWQK